MALRKRSAPPSHFSLHIYIRTYDIYVHTCIYVIQHISSLHRLAREWPLSLLGRQTHNQFVLMPFNKTHAHGRHRDGAPALSVGQSGVYLIEHVHVSEDTSKPWHVWGV